MLAETSYPMTRTALAVAPLLLAGVAGQAVAGAPDALTFVPSDTPIYAVIPDLGGLIGDLSAMNQALAGKLPPEAAQLGMGLFFAQTLATQPGVETNGSAAVIIDPEGGEVDDFGDQQPSYLAILPIDDMKAFNAGPFMAGQNAKIVNGVLEAQSPEGEAFYMRDIGTHVIAGDNAEKIRGYEPGEWMGAHTKALGEAGLNTLGGGDLILVANIAMLQGQIDEAMRQAEQQANFAAMMGGGEQVTQGFAMIKNAAEAVERDGSVGLVSFNVGAEGISLDAGVSFREGTPSAGMFRADGDTSPLVGALPQTDFLAAYAFDSSSKSLRDLVNGAMQMLPMQAGNDFGMKAVMEHATGFSGVVGTSPAALGGAGLLARQLNYVRCENTRETIGVMRSGIEQLDGQSAAGVSYATTYEAGAAEVDGVKVDTYSVKSQMDPSAGGGAMMMMDPAMIQNMLFGMTGGPTGYVAGVDGGFYSTVSKNSELLSGAFKASKGGDSLAGNALLGGVSARLHENRIAEAYVSADQIFNAFGPFAQMLGMIDGFEPMEAMAPVGMSLRGDGGGLMGRVVLPADVIGFIAEFAGSVEADDAMMGGDDAEPEPDF